MAVGCSSAYQSQLYLEVDHCFPLQWTDLKLRQAPLPQQKVLLLLMQTQFREWSNFLTSSTLFVCVQLTKRWSAWWSSLWRYKEGCIQRITGRLQNGSTPPQKTPFSWWPNAHADTSTASSSLISIMLWILFIDCLIQQKNRGFQGLHEDLIIRIPQISWIP